MIYKNARDLRRAEGKHVLLFGMSGVGKTHTSNILRKTGDWFHYSVDYRIGTRYMGEHIVDNFKREAMKNKFLANLLRTDSIYIASNITFNNLAPLSTYLGKPGSTAKGGLPFDEYCRRQRQHQSAEVAALRDTLEFIKRSKEIYRYQHFVCDSGGSICEVVDPHNPDDTLLNTLCEKLLLVWVKEQPGHAEELIRRFNEAPKPMYYRPSFLNKNWKEYCELNGVKETGVDPNAFARWIYARAMESRQPRYEAMARHWGITIDAEVLKLVTSENEFTELVAEALVNH